jgi:hypothetical protein
MKLVGRWAECGMLDRSAAPAVCADVRHNLLGENIKDVAGYDAERLLVGSRRAFGIATTAIFNTTVNARGGSHYPEWK